MPTVDDETANTRRRVCPKCKHFERLKTVGDADARPRKNYCIECGHEWWEFDKKPIARRYEFGIAKEYAFTCDHDGAQCKIVYQPVARDWSPVPEEGIKHCAEQTQAYRVPGTVTAFLVKRGDGQFHLAIPIVSEC